MVRTRSRQRGQIRMEPVRNACCGFCGHCNPHGANFCNDCGSPLHLKPCTGCDAVDRQDALNCRSCGQAFDDAPAAQTLYPGHPHPARATRRCAKHGHAALIAAGLCTLGAWTYTVYRDKPPLLETPTQAFSQTRLDAAPSTGHSSEQDGVGVELGADVAAVTSPRVATEPFASGLAPASQAAAPQQPADGRTNLVAASAQSDCARLLPTRQAAISRGAKRPTLRRATARPLPTAGGSTAAVSNAMPAELTAPAAVATERKTRPDDSVAPIPLPKTDSDSVPWAAPRLYEG